MWLPPRKLPFPVCVGDGVPSPGSLGPHKAWHRQTRETEREGSGGWAGSGRLGEGDGSTQLAKAGDDAGEVRSGWKRGEADTPGPPWLTKSGGRKGRG